MIIKCIYCPAEFKKINNRIHCNSPECLTKWRSEKERLSRIKNTTTCRHCLKPFKRERHAGRRLTCYEPECVELERQRVRTKQAQDTKQYRHKLMTSSDWDYRCWRCRVPLKSPRRKICAKCESEVCSDNCVVDNFIYA